MNLVPKNHLLKNLIYIYPTYCKYSHILLQKYYLFSYGLLPLTLSIIYYTVMYHITL